jgi:hypothetical protein
LPGNFTNKQDFAPVSPQGTVSKFTVHVCGVGLYVSCENEKDADKLKRSNPKIYFIVL